MYSGNKDGGGGWGMYMNMFVPTLFLHTFTHLPLFQSRILECPWELLPILPRCPASINSILLEIFQQLVGGEVVVEEHVIFVLQIFGQLLHHVCSKSFYSPFSFASINIEPTKVAVGTISQYPHFDSTLRWLLRHVLFQAGTTLKLDHGLIYSDLLRWFIECCELVAEMSDQGSKLTMPIVCWITTWRKMVVIHRV